MNKPVLFAAAALLAMATAANAADLGIRHHRHHGHYGHAYGLPYAISYLHNYGPGAAAAGTFAYYDGPSHNFCFQGSAAYTGQDHQRHPCF